MQKCKFFNLLRHDRARKERDVLPYVIFAAGHDPRLVLSRSHSRKLNLQRSLPTVSSVFQVGGLQHLKFCKQRTTNESNSTTIALRVRIIFLTSIVC